MSESWTYTVIGLSRVFSYGGVSGVYPQVGRLWNCSRNTLGFVTRSTRVDLKTRCLNTLHYIPMWKFYDLNTIKQSFVIFRLHQSTLYNQDDFDYCCRVPPTTDSTDLAFHKCHSNKPWTLSITSPKLLSRFTSEIHTLKVNWTTYSYETGRTISFHVFLNNVKSE